MNKRTIQTLASIAVVLLIGSSCAHADDDPIKAKLLELFPQVDANGDGVISDAEQAAMTRQVLKRRPQIDKDGDGVLSDAEMKALLRIAAKRAKPQPAPKPTKPAKPTTENTKKERSSSNAFFSTAEILDESTLETKTLQDWHPVGATRQKLIEINVAEWWPGQDYRIPVRLIVPLKGKAKGFHITGGHTVESVSKDFKPNASDARLLAGGVGIVRTVVKNLNTIPGKRGLEKKMQRQFMKGLNLRYNPVWIWSMTLMRATTAAYAEVDHFEKGKVAGSGGSKNGISPAVALINDERFTATCSSVAFAWASPIRKSEPGVLHKVQAANTSFFEAVKAGEFKLKTERAKYYRSHMKGSGPSMEMMAKQAGIPMDESRARMDRFMTSVCVTENWDRLKKRGVDMLFQPGTHDWVAYDILWGAQNHPRLPVYYAANGGHGQQNHPSAESDNENLQAFLWNHFFGGEPLLSPPTSSHKVIGDKLKITVSFENGPKAESGRIWWMYDRAPAGSAPFLHEPIPKDQWADMKRDTKTGEWTATIPLKDGFERIDFFTNHGHITNGYKQYLSSPYTRVELSPSPN